MVNVGSGRSNCLSNWARSLALKPGEPLGTKAESLYGSTMAIVWPAPSPVIPPWNRIVLKP